MSFYNPSVSGGLVPRQLTASPDGYHHATIASLIVNIAADTSELRRSVEEAVGHLESFQKVAEKAAEVLGIGLGVEGVKKMVEGFADASHQLENLSRATGTTTTDLQELKFAATESGVEFETLARGMERLESQIGTGKAADGLQQIGISIGQIQQSGGGAAFMEVASAIAAIEDPMQRAAAATQIFGRQGLQLLPLLTSNVEELRQKAEQLGLVMSEETVRAGADLEKAWAQLTMSGKTLLGEVLTPMVPALTGVMDALTRVVGLLKETNLGMAGGLLFGLTDLNAMAVQAGASIGELPKVADPWTKSLSGMKVQVQSLTDAEDMQKTAGQYLTDEVNKQIQAYDKHKNSVDSIINSLTGDTAHTRDQVEALSILVKQTNLTYETQQRMLQSINDLESKGVELNDTIYTWQTAYDTLAGTQDTVAMGLSQLGQLVPENTAHIQDMTAAFDDARSHLDDLTSSAIYFDEVETSTGAHLGGDLIPMFSTGLPAAAAQSIDMLKQAHQALDDIANAGQNVADTLDKSLIKTFEGLPGTLARAFEGAGGLSGAMKSLGAQLGKDFSTGLTGSIQASLGVGGPGLSGTGLGSAGALGGLAGVGAGLSSASAGSQLGEVGLAGAATAAGAIGMGATIASAAALGAATAGIGAAVVGVIALIKSLGVSQEELQGRNIEAKFQNQFGSFQAMMDAVGAAYLATGRTAQQAEADVAALLAAEKNGQAAAQGWVNTINQAFTDQAQDVQTLQAAISKYHLSLEDLGPALKKQNLDAQAQTLINDWRVLVQNGVDVAVVNEHMASSVEDYLKSAIKTGTEVPAAMEPILQKMIDQGDLTDAAGNKITDLAQLGVHFSETMTQGFQKVVDKLDQLLQKIGMVPGALNGIPKTVDINADVHYHIPDLPKIGDIPTLATGGIVTAPTLAMIGESGPEVVMPLGSFTRPGPTINLGVELHLGGIAVTSTGGPGQEAQQLAATLQEVARQFPAMVLNNVGGLKSDLKRALDLQTTRWATQ